MLFLGIAQGLMAMYSRPCTDEDMGNFWGSFWLIARWGAWEALGLKGKEGSELKGSRLSQSWNVINKVVLLPALIVGSLTKA